MTDSYGNGFQAPRTKMPELADALDIAPMRHSWQSH